MARQLINTKQQVSTQFYSSNMFSFLLHTTQQGIHSILFVIFMCLVLERCSQLNSLRSLQVLALKMHWNDQCNWILILYVLWGNWLYLFWLLIVNIKLGQSTNGSLFGFDYAVICAYALANQPNQTILWWISQTTVYSINVWHLRFQKLFKLLNLKFLQILFNLFYRNFF